MVLIPLLGMNETCEYFISGISVLFHCSVCLFMSGSYCFVYCSFVVSFELGKGEFSNFSFFLFFCFLYFVMFVIIFFYLLLSYNSVLILV